MLSVKSPIGKLILYSYQEPQFLAYTSIKKKIENIVDLIKFQTLNKGIEYTSNSLQNDLFEVRIELVNLLLERPDILKQFEKTIIDEIVNKYQRKKYQAFGLIIADSLEAYLKIYAPIARIISDHVPQLISYSIGNEMPSLDSLKLMALIQPSKELENYLRWIEASLSFDYCLITSDLFLNDEIDLKEQDISTLELFIERSITDFGSYSIINGLWNPDNEDESRLIRNIKIKTAVLETKNDRGFLFSNEAFQELLK